MVTDSISVRPVTADDFAQWKPLWDGYNAFYGREGPTALPPGITAATWARFHDTTEPMHALVDAAYRAAREAGSQRVYWLTHETNATARRLYDKVAENSGVTVYRKVI